MENEPREWWIALCPSGKISEIQFSQKRDELGPLMLPPCSNQDLPSWVPLVERELYDALKAETENLSTKLQRTVSAAYHALLEMSAWMGIPEDKRHERIKYLMENVKYCAEHDLRHVDEQQATARWREMAENLAEAMADIFQMMDDGSLCRDISDDHKPDYTLRMLKFVERLALAKQSLAQFEEAKAGK